MTNCTSSSYRPNIEVNSLFTENVKRIHELTHLREAIPGCRGTLMLDTLAKRFFELKAIAFADKTYTNSAEVNSLLAKSISSTRESLLKQYSKIHKSTTIFQSIFNWIKSIGAKGKTPYKRLLKEQKDVALFAEHHISTAPDFDAKKALAHLWQQTLKNNDLKTLRHFIQSIDEKTISNDILEQLIDHISNSSALRSKLTQTKEIVHTFKVYMKCKAKNLDESGYFELAQSFLIKTAYQRDDIHYTLQSIQTNLPKEEKIPDKIYQKLLNQFLEI